MSIPGQKFIIRDGGGFVPAAGDTYCYLGCSQMGDVTQLVAASDGSTVQDTFGQGPLSEDMCLALVQSPVVYGIRIAGSVVGVAGAVTKTVPVGTSPTGTITVAGAPYDSYSVRITISVTGGPATNPPGEFQYSLDGGASQSPSLVIPSGLSFPIPNTNLTLTFVPGAGGTPGFYNLGDLHSFECVAPGFTPSDLAAAIAVLNTSNVMFAAIVLCKEMVTVAPAASDALLYANALSGHALSLFSRFQFIGFICDGGADTPAATKTAFANYQDSRACIGYGDAFVVTRKPFVGWSVARRPTSSVIAARLASLLPSQDAGRIVDQALPGVLNVSHNEAQTELMDQKKFSTLRTHIGYAGFFITNANLFSPVGSDYEWWQHRRCMDLACAVVYLKQALLLNRGAAVNTDGTIKPASAMIFESTVMSALRVVLIDPDNAEGEKGHVSDISYTIARDVNMLATGQMKTKVAILPLGYVKAITTELGFQIAGA